MTKRAERAADELKRRGWSVKDSDSRSCNVCWHNMAELGRYCPQCGASLPESYAEGVLDDVEAAIAAAVDKPKKGKRNGTK